ncbi:MAG: hypothetical protein ACKVOE_07145 [Rickettsiales bacterium]
MAYLTDHMYDGLSVSDTLSAASIVERLPDALSRRVVLLHAVRDLRTDRGATLTRSQRLHLQRCQSLADIAQVFNASEASEITAQLAPLLERYADDYTHRPGPMLANYQAAIGGDWRTH